MMDIQELEKRQAIAVKLAREISQMVMESTGKLKTEQKESFADLVTEADKAVEKFLFEKLRKAFPDDKFIGEESANKDPWTDTATWIIDPIDGTTNFVHTFPYFCISIGLTYNKIPTLAVIYNPSLDHMYTAIKGHGAFLAIDKGAQSLRLKTRDSVTKLEDALINTEFGGTRDEEKKLAVFANLESVAWASHGVRCLGSAAMNICSVASGHSEGYYEFGIHIWDIAAAVLILTEAGGYACDTQGGPLDLQARRLVAASSETMGQQIAKCLKIHLTLERD